MVNYKRNISTNVHLLWAIFIMGVAGLTYLLIAGSTLNAFLLLFILFAFSFLEVRGLTLMDEAILVDKLYCYGFRRKHILINEQSGVKAELFVNGDIDYAPNDDSPLDLVILLIPFLYKKYALWLKTSGNKTLLILKLTKREFALLNVSQVCKKSVAANMKTEI